MSAIWGQLSFDNNISKETNTILQQVYERKCKIDSYNHACMDKCFMGCGIQYITRESVNESLPVLETNTLISADCILDNRNELIQKLKISNSNNLSDGTLIKLSYFKWGIDFLKKLRGMYSIAIYDSIKDTLYLASDHTSSRCLYYYKKDNTITFSTLIAPIRKLYPDIRINDLYIKDFLTAPGLMPNISSNETSYDGIYKLNPGSYIKFTPDGMEEKSYWNPSLTHEGCQCKTATEYGDYFRKLYTDIIRDSINTTGEVGIAMSSGFDSASAGALAADELSKINKPLYTYTYIPYEEAASDRNKNNIHNEKEDVLNIAKMHSNMNTTFLNNNGKNCIEEIPEILDIMEMPFKAFVNLPNLCEIYRTAAEKGCKVVLTGQCGNSTISHGYIDDVLCDLYLNKRYIKFLSYLNNYSKYVKESRKAALKGCIGYFNYTKEIMNSNTFAYTLQNEFVSDNIFEGYPLEERYSKNQVNVFDTIPSTSKFYRDMLYKKAMYTYMGELETKIGLKYGIIVRDPTKDMRMLSFCYHLPYHIFAYKGIPRWLIRNNLSDILPSDILNNWMRYGVQNSDWWNRIIRDWNKIYPHISDTLFSNIAPEYYKIVAIRDFLEEIETSPESVNENRGTYLVFLYVVLLHKLKK